MIIENGNVGVTDYILSQHTSGDWKSMQCWDHTIIVLCYIYSRVMDISIDSYKVKLVVFISPIHSSLHIIKVRWPLTSSYSAYPRCCWGSCCPSFRFLYFILFYYCWSFCPLSLVIVCLPSNVFKLFLLYPTSYEIVILFRNVSKSHHFFLYKWKYA
jgi:hypothetical protein